MPSPARSARPVSAHHACVERLEGRRLLSVSLVSQNMTGVGTGNGASTDPVVTPDGRYVAFVSRATDLAPGIAPNSQNVFVRDLLTHTTRLVSADAAGLSGASGTVSDSPSISDDGRYVAFASNAALVGPATNSTGGVYVRDLQANTTTLVSVAHDGGNPSNGSGRCVISGDGSSVAFISHASNLVPGVPDGTFSPDLFVRDLRAGVTRLASVTADGRAAGFADDVFDLSFDGRRVAFVALSLLPADQSPDAADVYVRDVALGVTTLVSVNAGGVSNANWSSYNPSMSDDGRFVAFQSAATDLVPGHTGGLVDVFVRDLQTGTTRQVSTADGTTGASGPGGNGEADSPVISRDGRYVAFASNSSDLVSPPENNGEFDVYLRDTQANTTTLVSARPDGAATGGIVRPRSGIGVSDDGRFVTFECRKDNHGVLPDDNTVPDVFVRDLAQRQTWLLSTNRAGTAAGIGASGSNRLSADGRVAVFVSNSFDMAENDNNAGNDVFAAAVPGARVASTVAGRRAFYNHSAFDGGDAAPGPGDDAAIATDKQALLPGQIASAANITSYSRGLNGIMVDIANLPAGGVLSADDFSFRSGTTQDSSAWADGPRPAEVALRRGAGVGGSDRVTLTWADFDPNIDAINLAVADGWLRVAVKANERTGLAAEDVFYFGNLRGESANSPTAATVNAVDLAQTRAAQLTAATVTSRFDFNRDGRVNAVDLAICRANQLRSLPLLAPAVPVAGSPIADFQLPVDGFFPTGKRKRGIGNGDSLLD